MACVWFSATVVQETCCAIETGKPLCPSDRQLLIAQSIPCLLAILADHMQACSNAAHVGAARGANVRHPRCHCQGPAGPGFVRIFWFVVWWLCVVGHCCSLFPSVACSCCNHNHCCCCGRRWRCCCRQTQHHDLGRKEEGRPILALLPGIPQEQDQPHSTELSQKVTATLQSHPQQ